MSIMLNIQGVSKAYAGNPVLSDISFEVRAGEIHGLIGENGAGKSTLINIIAGIVQRDAGVILVNGEEAVFDTPVAAMNAGISVVHQELSLIPSATVVENIYLRREITNRLGLNNWRAMREATEKHFARLGLDVDPANEVRRLSVGMQQMVEVAKATALDARLLILDEPTSALAESEVRDLFLVLENLKRNGVAIIFVSHKLDELIEICDRVTVLRDGRHVATRAVSETQKAELIRLMVGRSLDELYPPLSDQIGDELFRCEGLSRFGLYEDIYFSVRRGEIVGIAGLIGSGRTEAMRGIVNADRRDAGRFFLEGSEISIQDPATALRHGICYVSEDRKRSGIFLAFNVGDNIGASVLGQLTGRAGLLSSARIDAFACGFIADLDIRPADPGAKAFSLSGGNQQKVLLGKAMASKLRLLIVDEPTRGVDIGAKAAIHKKLRALANQGIGVVVVSSELNEVMGLSDRVLVFCGGVLSADLDNNSARLAQEEVMRWATVA
jgi:ribose transport system ATP-binding protein